jgi:S1-C subfamily serine protease
MKKLIAVLLIMMITSCQESVVDLVEKSDDKVVYIRMSKFVNGEVLTGGGSGFFISDDGLIVTNCHVVCDADVVLVGVNKKNGFYKAEVLVKNPKRDLALIKIYPGGNSMLNMGNKLEKFKYFDLAFEVKRGESVLAMGSPLGLYGTVTLGIVSHNYRVFPYMSDGYYSDGHYIQSDVDIASGNSGGPLINRKGKVIGVNTFIMNYSGSPTKGATITFSVPSIYILELLEELVEQYNNELKKEL